ncbi:transposase [Streptomyces sp. NPDC088801]|uniref:transposase n=1 Tax=Streptomyces sp. NPDC088801 TaxID=3365903 RepID=UPI00380CAC4A
MHAPRKYALELRERAVRMSRAPEPKPVIRRMAEELGVHHEALRGWIRRAEADAGESDDLLTSHNRAEPAEQAADQLDVAVRAVIVPRERRSRCLSSPGRRSACGRRGRRSARQGSRPSRRFRW